MTSVDSTTATAPVSQLARARQQGLPGAGLLSAARAAAAIAARAAADCYGVAGLAPRHSGLGPIAPLAPERAARGVEARMVDGRLVVDVWVILESGVRVIEVAHNIMVGVAYAVEEALGLCVARVNVNIQALRAGPL